MSKDTPKADKMFIQHLGRWIALLSILGILLHLLLRYALHSTEFNYNIPLFVVLSCGGLPIILELAHKILRAEFGADILAGISIVTSILLGEYLAGALVVLMLSGGEALEALAMRRASAVLEALAKRMPSIAHRREPDRVMDIAISDIAVGDLLEIFPHEICPVDGVVVEGRSSMDEAYLTGEPFLIKKIPGTEVVSGAINGDGLLVIRAERQAKDSRYAKIMEVMEQSRQHRPRIRRLADTLGAWYTPLAVLIATLAWISSGEAVRFLSVLVIATPCPLLIAIPISIIGTISLAAKRSIIIKDPAILEQLPACHTIIFDKTGTLTYGEPALTSIHTAAGQSERTVLELAASAERYSKHPLAAAVLNAAEDRGIALRDAAEVQELPGQGLQAKIDDKSVFITGRTKLAEKFRAELPAVESGLECIVIVDDRYAATFHFHDKPRPDTPSFVRHLPHKHSISEVILLSGDRESEVSYLADMVGIQRVYWGKSPEEKVEIVREEVRKAPTLFLGDGINDAPALLVATVGIAFGPRSDITSEAAGAVILDPALKKLDELLHIGLRMRRIALQSAVGGMALSIVGMAVAATGGLSPVQGAIAQELIDLFAVVNALRTAAPRHKLTDFQ